VTRVADQLFALNRDRDDRAIVHWCVTHYRQVMTRYLILDTMLEIGARK